MIRLTRSSLRLFRRIHIIWRAEHVSAASTRPRGARRRQTLRDTVTLDMWSCSLLEYHIYHVGKLPLCVPVRFDRV